MRFTVLQENLAKGINIVGKAVSPRASLPVLGNILIASDKGRLKLAATDLDKGFTTWIGAKIDEEGGITVPARFFADFVNNLQPSQLEGVVEGNILTLRAEGASAKFHGIAASEFPLSIDTSDSVKRITFTKNDIFEALNEVAFAAANDEGRPILTGVLVRIVGNTLYLVAVDGFRLSERKVLLDEKYPEEVSLVVPARTLLEVFRVAQSLNTPISLSISPKENLAIFEGEDILATTRILEGEFPDYKKIIPQSSSVKMKVNVKNFLDAVKMANVFAKDASNVVKLLISPQEGLFVSSDAYEIGSNKTHVDASVEGDSLEAIFDGRFLHDFLSNIKADEIIFETEGSLNPAVLKPVGRDDYIHIVMPRRP